MRELAFFWAAPNATAKLMSFDNKHWIDGTVNLHKLLNLNAKHPAVMTHALNLRTTSHFVSDLGNLGSWHLYANMECLLAGANLNKK